MIDSYILILYNNEERKEEEDTGRDETRRNETKQNYIKRKKRITIVKI